MDAGAQEPVPADASLEELRAAAAGCTACHLHELGTQTVFGEGPPTADLMLVGEQPGTSRTARAGRSSVRPVACSTARWPRPASPASAPT